MSIHVRENKATKRFEISGCLKGVNQIGKGLEL